MDTPTLNTSPDQSAFELFCDKEFVALASVQFVSGMALATILIALALYADLFKVSGTIAGLFGSAYAVGRLFFVLPLGRKIDTGNSKKYLLIGLGLNILVLIGFIFINSVEHIILIRLIQAAGITIIYLTGVAVVGEIAPDNTQGMWIGTYNQVRSIASLVGDIVGGLLLFLYGFDITYLSLVILTIVSVSMVFIFVRDNPGSQANPEKPGVESLLQLLKRKTIISLVVFRFTFSFGKMAVILFLPIYARTEFGMNALLIGGILAGGKLTKGITQGYVGKLSDSIGRKELFIFVGTVTYALGTAIIPVASYSLLFFDPFTISNLGLDITITPAFFVLFISYGILGLADSLRLPTSVTLFIQEGELYDSVAASLSLRVVFWQIGAILGPLVVGSLFDTVSYLVGFWLASVFMIVAAIIFMYLYE